MIYQDEWVNGSIANKGIRECASRYDIIKAALDKDPPKSVLDIGANMCYFGLRLIEDFDCSVMAFEFNSFQLRKVHVQKNKTKNLMLLERKISLQDLSILSNCCYFDLILALSVLHHVPGEIDKWIEKLRRMSKILIIEFALEDSDRTKTRKNYIIPEDGITIGYGNSHLKEDFNRPIILFK